MKKMNVFVLATLVAAGSVFTGCTEEEISPAPQITFSNNVNEVTLESGVTTYQINADITTEVGLKDVKLFKVTSDEEVQIGAAITNFDDDNNYPLRASVTGITSETVVKVQATDKDDRTSSKNFTIKVTGGGGTAGEVASWSAQIGSYNSALGSSFASSNGQVYSAANAKANYTLIDWVYYWGGATDATLAAPSSSTAASVYSSQINGLGTWNDRNETKFVKTALTSTQFDAIPSNDDSAIKSAVGTPTLELIGEITVGQVLGFKTEAGKLGLIKVTNIAPEAAGSISIAVKVQK